MGVSLTCSIAESRDQTKFFFVWSTPFSGTGEPRQFLHDVSDTLYELLQNFTIGGAGNRTHSEKRSSKSATAESIAFHFTDERIQIAKNEMKDVWPQAITAESVLRTHLQLRSRKLTEAQNAKVRKLNEERRA